jgi:hypothetical protein
MLRFLPALIEQAELVVLGIAAELSAFVAFNFEKMSIVSKQNTTLVGDADCHAFMMSLPYLVGALPQFQPLRAPAPCRPLGHARDPRLHIGLCWAGNPDHWNDANRSMPLAACQRLLERTDMQWYNLYIGPHAAEAAAYPSLVPSPVVLRTFADTANVVAGLDCVVSVDTAVAHLAGCLAVPTFLLLPSVAEWRWGHESTTPWYPTMRLIRQRVRYDWRTVVDQLEVELDRVGARIR